MNLARNPKEIRRLRPSRQVRARWLLLLGFLTLLPDLLGVRHEYFGFAGFFGFYAGVAVVAGVALVLIVRLARRCLIRPEDYYERRD